MHYRYYYIALMVTLLALAGCEEPYDVDLSETDPQLVVEGRVTDRPGPYTVLLSTTSDYFANEDPPTVSGALVTITEDDLLTDTLAEVAPGEYQTTFLQGKVGSTYRLDIATGGESYTSASTMAPVAPIDSLNYYFQEESIFQDEGYYVRLYAQEPQGIGNFYQWFYFENDTMPGENDWLYASDEQVDGNYIGGIEFGYPHEIGDTIVIWQMSVDEASYEFLRQIDEQESFGDLFDTPPANIESNVSNNALGAFMVSSVDTAMIVIEN